MIIRKKQVIRFGIPDPSEILVWDTEEKDVVRAYLLSKLNECYAKKCNFQCYIIEITKILDENIVIEFADYGVNGGAKVDLVVEIKCIVYNKGDIIPDCIVKEAHLNGPVIARNDTAGCCFRNSESSNILSTKGTKLPVFVDTVNYDIENACVIIGGFPFIPTNLSHMDLIFKIEGVMSNEDKKIINAKLKIAKDLHKHINDLNKVDVGRFVKLLYRYKKRRVISKKFKKIELDTDIKDGMVIGRPHDMSKDEFKMYKMDSHPSIIVENPRTALEALIDDYIQYNTYISELVRVYGGKLYGESKLLWAYFEKNKQ